MFDITILKLTHRSDNKTYECVAFFVRCNYDDHLQQNILDKRKFADFFIIN